MIIAPALMTVTAVGVLFLKDFSDFSTFAGLPTATEATIAVTMTIVIGVLGLIFVLPALCKTKGQKVEQYA